jgi:hypothetical protein
VNIQVNKSSLEKAEETLILDLKNKALREWKSQLQTMNNKKVGYMEKADKSKKKKNYFLCGFEISILGGIKGAAKLRTRANNVPFALPL